MNYLHNYQKKAVDFIEHKKKCALFLDMGLGKTLITLNAINNLINKNLIKKVLILAPLRVCNSVWYQESRKFDNLKNLDFSIITGTIPNKKIQLNKNSIIHLVNFDNLNWLFNNIKTFDYDMLVIDESSAFKSPATNRFKIFASKRTNILDKLKYTVLLTGTPLSNGYLDLWSQIYLLDKGQRLFNSFYLYKQIYFKSNDYMGYTLTLKDGSDNSINKSIQDVVLTMKKEDYIDLPKCLYYNEYVDFDKELQIKYNYFEKNLIYSLKDNENTINAINSADKTNKLLQFCNGAMYLEDKSYTIIHDLKLKLLKNLILENPNENFLIAYTYKHDLERIIKFFENDKEVKGIEVFEGSDSQVKKWNDKLIKVMLCHPKSTAHGLNLQNGGNTIIWYGLTWSLELYQQFNSRLHRQGQLKPVKIIHLLVRNSIENKLINSIEFKNQTQFKLLDFLKKYYLKNN